MYRLSKINQSLPNNLGKPFLSDRIRSRKLIRVKRRSFPRPRVENRSTIKRRKNICIKITVMVWKEREGEDRNGCPSVAREISARWFGNGRRIACFLRLWWPGWLPGWPHGDGFVCVYQNTHLIIPRIAVGAESGYAAARLFRA